MCITNVTIVSHKRLQVLAKPEKQPIVGARLSVLTRCEHYIMYETFQMGNYHCLIAYCP